MAYVRTRGICSVFKKKTMGRSKTNREALEALVLIIPSSRPR
jgi:hypothetical protein